MARLTPEQLSKADALQLLVHIGALEEEIAALREPMACGHPKACWVEDEVAESSRLAAFVSAIEGGHCTACERDRLERVAALREVALSLCVYCQRGVPMFSENYHDNSKNTSSASSECFIHPFCEATRVHIPPADARLLDAALLKEYQRGVNAGSTKGSK